MANIIIHNEERQRTTEAVARSYGISSHDRAGMEAAETIAVRSIEAVQQGSKGGR